MKKTLAFILAGALLLGACNASRKSSATTSANAAAANNDLTGTWELDHVANPSGTIEQLYPEKKPNITFNDKEGTYNGYAGCNTFRGKLDKNKETINFTGEMMMTRMACPGDGEKIFLENLKRINHFSVSADGKELTFIQGDMALMHFHKMAQ